MLALVMAAHAPAWASVGGVGVEVTQPNGYAAVRETDLRVQSVAGEVRWGREWNGLEWKFNPHWESLSQSWKNLTGSQTADTTGATISGSGGAGATSGGSGGGESSQGPVYSAGGSGGGGGDSGCWVWVDEDWSPSSGTVLVGGTPVGGGITGVEMAALRMSPFNRVIGDTPAVEFDYAPPRRVSVDYAALCMRGQSMSGQAPQQDVEAIRRINELYLGDAGRYAFNNRSVLEKRAVNQLPAVLAHAPYTVLETGSMAINAVVNPKGYRWTDRGGAWIDYNTQGQVVAYGDRNNNTVWLVRDTTGAVRGVVDGSGHVVYTLYYTGALITEVRDYPVAGNGLDLPARRVVYEYDALNRLKKVTDARGYVTQYDYDAANHLTKITDQEERFEQLEYAGNTVKKHTAADGGVTDYEFDYDDTNKQFVSKITGPETAAGRRVEHLTHNRVGKLVRQLINGRTENEVRYDTGARAEFNTNARGFTTRTTRNEFEQTTETAYPDGGAVKRSYSALHLELMQTVDELGIKTQYERDGLGNLLKTTEAVGLPEARTTEYARNGLGQVTSVTRKGRVETNGVVTADAVWQFSHDSLGQMRQAIDPQGQVHGYTYDRAGNLQSYTDPNGHTTRYEVDALGNLLKVTNALGEVSSYSYDKVGNLRSATDARGKTIQLAYDAMNRPQTLTNAVGGIGQVQYNAQGRVVQSSDEDGVQTRLEYDNFLRLNKLLDGLNNVTQMGYQIADGSAAGQLGSVAAPTQLDYPSFTQLNRFDAMERPTSRSLKYRNAQGEQTVSSTVTYDKRGQVLTETNANGYTRSHRYDALGQRMETTDALSGKTSYRYDARGNVLEVSDAKGNTHRFEYDRNDRMVKETRPLGQTVQYQYDGAGQLKQKTEPDGTAHHYTRDAANRVTQIVHKSPSGQVLRTVVQGWNANGQLTSWSDTDAVRNQTSSATLSYDDAGRKLGETITYPGGNTLGYSYGYSPSGKKTRLTWPDGTQIDYGYSAHGELQSVTIPGEGTMNVTAYRWTAPQRLSLPGSLVQNRNYDGLLNLESLAVQGTGEGSQPTTLSLSHTYGKEQELKSRSRTDNAQGASSTRTEQYAYDRENRLTTVESDTGGLLGSNTETFVLDAVANRVEHSQTSGPWQYDANNRLTKVGSGSCGQSSTTCYQWDDRGNLTQKTQVGRSTYYRYDSSNRLSEVAVSTNGGAQQTVARYGYDPQNRRLWKEQYADQTGQALAQAKRSYYLYADEGLIAESQQAITVNADGSASAAGPVALEAQYGPRPSSLWGTGALFVRAKNSNQQETIAYYHHDHLGTPIQATDKQGRVVWAASYEAFGKASITTPPATAEAPTINSQLRLPGQYEDTETGLYYNFNRYYDPSTGRYVTQDPIGLEGGINIYAYVWGNPLFYFDSHGENLIVAAGIAVLGAAYAGYEFINAVSTAADSSKATQQALQDSNRQIDNMKAGKPVDLAAPGRAKDAVGKLSGDAMNITKNLPPGTVATPPFKLMNKVRKAVCPAEGDK